MSNESVFDSDEKFSNYIDELTSKPIVQGLTALAANATANLPVLWKSTEEKNAEEYTLKWHSSVFDRQREAASKVDVLKPLIYDPLALFILPSILSLPYSTQEEKESIEREAEIVKDFWSGK